MKLNAEDIASYSDFTLTYYKGDKTAAIKMSSDTAIIYNGKVLDTEYDKAFGFENGFVTIISTDNVDTVIIEAYDTLRVTGIDISAKKIYAENIADGSAVQLDLNENTDKWVFFKNYPYGKEVNETMILADDIICVSKSFDGSYMRGWLCTQTVSGMAESTTGGENEIRYVQIGGEEYEVSRAYKDKILIGQQTTFVLDISGRIAAIGKNVREDRILGYVYQIADVSGTFDDEINLKIYNVNRRHEKLALADKVTLDGVSRTKDYVRQTLCSGAGGKLLRQPVFYRLNGDGKIKELDLAAPEGQGERDNTLEELLPGGSYSWLFTMKCFERRYVLSSKSYYLRVPPESIENPDEKLFGIQEFSKVTWWNNNNKKSIMGLYRYDDSTPYANLVIVSSSDNASLSNTTEVTMVMEVSEQSIGDGEQAFTLHGLQKGAEVTAYFDDGVYRGDIEEGDLIRYATNSAGYIGVYEKIYDVSEDKVLWNMTGTADEYTSNTTPTASLRYTMGYVNRLYDAPYTAGLNSVVMAGRQPDVPEDTWQFNASRYIIYNSDRREGKRVYMSGLDEIVSWETCRNIEDTTKVFVHTRQGYLSALFIYK